MRAGSVGGPSGSPVAISLARSALWFTESSANKIGRIAATGAFAEYPIPTANGFPFEITAGSDGALWFTEPSANQIGRVTTAQGNIFGTSFKNCNTLDVGYDRFINGTIVDWKVTTNGVGTVASGHFSAIGGGKLGSKTYHFINIPLGTTLKPEPVQSHVLFTWPNGGRFYATRDPGC